MRFDIYGRFQLEVRRENGAWAVYRADQGKRSAVHDIVIPADLAPDDIAAYLDDMYHEFADIGRSVELLPDRGHRTAHLPGGMK